MRKVIWCSAIGVAILMLGMSVVCYQAYRYPDSSVGRCVRSATSCAAAVDPITNLVALAQYVNGTQERDRGEEAVVLAGMEEGPLVPTEPTPMEECQENAGEEHECPSSDITLPARKWESTTPIVIPEPMPSVPANQPPRMTPCREVPVIPQASTPLPMPYCSDETTTPPQPMPYAEEQVSTDHKGIQGPAVPLETRGEEEEESFDAEPPMSEEDWKFWKGMFWPTNPSAKPNTDRNTPSPCEESKVGNPMPGEEEESELPTPPKNLMRKLRKLYRKHQRPQTDKSPIHSGIDTMEYRPSDGNLGEYGFGPL